MEHLLFPTSASRVAWPCSGPETQGSHCQVEAGLGRRPRGLAWHTLAVQLFGFNCGVVELLLTQSP